MLVWWFIYWLEEKFMELDYKIIIWVIAVIFTLWWYFYYVRDIFLWKTKPHIFSWLIWWVLTWIGFVIQYNDWAWPGAWITLVSAIICLLIAFLAIKYWEKNITFSDKVSFLSAIIVTIFWLLLDNPLLSIILIVVIDTLSFYPTFRKSWNNPWEETLIHYYFASFKFVLAIIALNNFSLLTLLYPLSLVIVNGVFIIMVLYRKKKLWIK